VLRKAVAELAELENLIDDEIESDPGSQNHVNNRQPQLPEDDDFLFDATLDFEKKVDFLSQLADDFATNLPEDVERAFEEVISALQTEGSDAILGLTEEKVIDDIDGVDYDNYIDSIIQHTQAIDLGDDDDFKFDMKIEGLEEYRQSLASSQTNDLEQMLQSIEANQDNLPVVVVHSPIFKPLPNLPESPEDSIDPSPLKSPRPDNVDAANSPRVLSPKKVTPNETMVDPVSPSRVITPRLPSPRHSIEVVPQIEVTAPKTPREPESIVYSVPNTQDDNKIDTPREPESAVQIDNTPDSDKTKKPRENVPEVTPSTPRQPTPRRDSTPKTTPRQEDPAVQSSTTPKTTPRATSESNEDNKTVATPRELPPSPGRFVEPSETTRDGDDHAQPSEPAHEDEDSSTSSDSESSNSSDNESSSEEGAQPQSPKADGTRTHSGSLKVPLLPMQDAQITDSDALASTARNSSARTSRRGSALTAADKQKIIAARREATLKMAQQLRDELKSGTADPSTKRQRLAQLLNEFKGVQVKGLINIFEQKMKEVVKK
jgi:hypothetical protein